MSTLIISDTHLFFKYSRVEDFMDVLRTENYDKLVLNGDIFDFEALRQVEWWDDKHYEALRLIRQIASYKEVTWVGGNHESMMTKVFSSLTTNINFVNSYHYFEPVSCQHIYVVHGDKFEDISPVMYWAGDWAYRTLLWLTKRWKFTINGKPLSKWCKDFAKTKIKAYDKTDKVMVDFAKEHGYDVVVTGHTHIPRNEVVEEVRLVNSGAFVEIATYVIEENGVFEVEEII